MTSDAKYFRIGLDLDGVIYQWTNTARFLLEWQFGIEIGESMYWDHIKEQITQQQWEWLWSSEKGGGVERGLFRHGHCYKGSFETLKELGELGDLVIITHRPKSAILDTMDWLSFHEVRTNEIHMLYREEQKSSISPQCQIYVDDKAANCVDLVENTDGLVCLWDRPWNQQEQKAGLPKNIIVINSWQQFIDLAKEEAWALSPASSE